MEALMVIASQQAPLVVLQQSIVDTMQKYTPVDTESAVVLLPALRGSKVCTRNKSLQAENWNIVLDHTGGPPSYAFIESHAADVSAAFLRDFPHLHPNTRIPYIVFIHSFDVRRAHRSAFALGNTTLALIRQFSWGQI